MDMNDWKNWDPIILLSYVNTKLRDAYEDLNALCDDLAIDRFALEEALKRIGYVYDVEQDRFVLED
jgi:hypothetical protein